MQFNVLMIGFTVKVSLVPLNMCVSAIVCLSRGLLMSNLISHATMTTAHTQTELAR